MSKTPTDSTATPKPRRVRTIFGRGVRENSGASAVEFAMIAPAFMALIVAILEVGGLFFAQQDIQTATSQAARLIMTGQAQNASMSSAQFLQQVCNNSAMLSCGGLTVNVQKYATFSSISTPTPVTAGAFSSASFQFNMGGPGDIIVVQVFYLWPVYGGPLAFNLANVNGSKHLLVGTAAFRNEPYK